MKSLLIGSALALALVISTFAQAIEKKDTPIPDITFIDGYPLLSISSVIRTVTQARLDLHENKLASAKESLQKAHLLIEMITATSPTTQSKDYIWVAENHLSYEGTEKVIQDLMPIYASLNALKNRQSAEKAGEHVKKAENFLGNKDKEGARMELELADKSLVYSGFDLNLSIAGEYIDIARDYVARNESEKADQTLNNAEDELRFIAVDLYAPLPLARKSLWLATKDYTEKQFDSVKKDLEQTKNYLEKAVESGNAKTKTEVKGLLRDLEVLKGKVEKREEAERKYIEGLWERTSALADREKEYISLTLKNVSKTNPVKKDLIDAKLHLSYAEAYHLTTGETHKAKAEIDKVEEYLKNAISQGDEAMKARLSSIEKDLTGLRSELNKRDNTIRGKYNTIENQLSEIIQKA